MFRIECFVDDKKLGQVLHALAGLAHGQPTVQPVVNATKTKKGLTAATNGQAIELMTTALKAVKKGTALTGKDFSAMLVAAGLRANVGYYATKAVGAGLVKRTGSTTNTRYVVQ